MADTPMDALRNAALMAFGAAYSTAEGVKSLVGEMVKRGSLTRDEAEKLATDLVDRGKQAKSAIDEKITKAVADYLKNAGLPTREEFDKLSERLAKLEQRAAQPETPLR